MIFQLSCLRISLRKMSETFFLP